jgi:hypothetical protein
MLFKLQNQIRIIDLEWILLLANSYIFIASPVVCNFENCFRLQISQSLSNSISSKFIHGFKNTLQSFASRTSFEEHSIFKRYQSNFNLLLLKVCKLYRHRLLLSSQCFLHKKWMSDLSPCIASICRELGSRNSSSHSWSRLLKNGPRKHWLYTRLQRKGCSRYYQAANIHWPSTLCKKGLFCQVLHLLERWRGYMWIKTKRLIFLSRLSIIGKLASNRIKKKYPYCRNSVIN